MSLAPFCDAPYGDKEAWNVFQLAHLLRHKTIASSVASQVTASKLSDIEPGKTEWMLDHAQTHMDICNALGINANPDLGETDLTKRENYEAWMAMHRTEHDLIDRALGL